MSSPDRSGMAAAQRNSVALRPFTPWPEVRVGVDITHDGHAAGADGGSDRPTASLVVAPGDMGRLDIVRFAIRPGNRANRLGLVLFRVANPGKLVTAGVHQSVAGVAEHLRFVGCMDDGRVAQIEHVQRTIGLFQS